MERCGFLKELFDTGRVTLEAEQWIIRNNNESLDYSNNKQMQLRFLPTSNGDCDTNAAEYDTDKARYTTEHHYEASIDMTTDYHNGYATEPTAGEHEAENELLMEQTFMP